MKNLFLTLALCLIALPACADVATTIAPQTDPAGKPYPKIVFNVDKPAQEVLLCKAAGFCTLLKSNVPSAIGTQYTSTNMDGYVDLVGPLTLENE